MALERRRGLEHGGPLRLVHARPREGVAASQGHVAGRVADLGSPGRGELVTVPVEIDVLGDCLGPCEGVGGGVVLRGQPRPRALPERGVNTTGHRTPLELVVSVTDLPSGWPPIHYGSATHAKRARSWARRLPRE